MKTNTIQVRDSFIVNALRNCGYNNYAAIADIIDNSVEPEVDATTVKIQFSTDSGKGGPIKSINIIDNGCGMDFDTMNEAMCLGSMTGKTGETNLGMYGAGLKTAALSLGKKLTVISRTQGSDYISKAVLDITEACKNGGPIELSIDKIPITDFQSNPEYLGIFEADHGTLVSISEIDRLANKDRKNFGGQLRNKIGEIFNKFITSNICKFLVDGIQAEAVNLMLNALEQNELLGSGDFEVEGTQFSFNAYYLPKEDTSDSVGEGASRNLRNQGLYIYRQNRLIGRGLTLGLWTRHPQYNGLRIELFTNGTCDGLLGTTFTKMVSEQSKETMSQSFHDILIQKIGVFINEAKNRGQRESATAKGETDPETQKMYDHVTKEMNDNLLLKINRRGENKPSEETKEHEHRGPQKNPALFRERKNKWLDGIKEVSLGRNEEMFMFEMSNNKRVVLINIDHPFYNEFYRHLPINLKHQMAKVITCHEIAKQNVNYYGSDDIQQLIDTYNGTISSEVGKSLSK